MGDFLRGSGDYWLCAAGAAAGFVMLSQVLRRRRRPVLLPRAHWGALAVILLAGYFYVDAAGRRPQERLVALFEGIAPTYALELSRMGHADLRVETAARDPRYLVMIEAVKRWTSANPLVSDIYTFRQRDDGAVVLLVDAETDYDRDGVFSGEREQRTPPGEVYPQVTEELRRAFRGEANFMARPVSDRWGSWVNMQVPMYDAAGRVEAVLGVDYDAERWLREAMNARRLAVVYIGVVLVLLLGSGAAIAIYRAELSARAAAEEGLRASLEQTRRENAERLAAEAARRESEQRLNLHVEQTPLAYVEWGPDGRVLRWNPAAEQIFGYTAAEALGRTFDQLIVPESALADVRAVCRRIAEEKIPCRHVNENRARDGRILVCEWHNTPLVDEHGALISVVSHAQDITERIRLEQHLKQGQKLESMGRLAGGVAHEFNNLLTPMLMQIGQIQDAYAGEQRLLEMLRPVEDAIMQAAQLNQRILAVGRRHAEGNVIGNLNLMIESSLDLLRHTLDRRIELDLRLAANLPPAELSKGAVMQVLMNLALNARDTLLAKLAVGGPPGWSPRLTIATHAPARPPAGASTRIQAAGACVALHVSDNGEGMDPELQRRVFEPFFTTKPTGLGTGLGLAVVWGVVEGLGGTIELHSVPGVGTTFAIYLPVARPVSALVPEPAAPPANPSASASLSAASSPSSSSPLSSLSASTLPSFPGPGRRVLLVEDNELVRDTFREALRHAGHDVVCADDGEAGLAALETTDPRRPYDVLVADLNMPRLSGREMLTRLRGRRLARRIIIVSGVVDAGLADEMRRLGVDRLLAKPLGLGELLSAVSELTRDS